jgi:uncharacterized membrane protein
MALTGSLGDLVLAVGVFLLSHSITNLRGFRRAAERRLGHTGFVAAYSVVSTVLLVWAIAAYLDAPTVVVWEQAGWMRWAPSLAMPFACLLWVIGMTTPNPFSIGPGGKRFDPARPGILRLTRHPVVWGLALWAAAHILPNGDVAALMLFVPLLALALAGPTVLDAKRRRQLGYEEWSRLAAATRGRLDAVAMLREIGPARIIGGLALFALLFALHQPVIGVTPVP